VPSREPVRDRRRGRVVSSDVLTPGIAALAVYESALRRAATGRPAPLTLRGPDGAEQLVDPALWCRDRLPGDVSLLARCSGPTLDIGCGPGRLSAALTGMGVPALGIDVSAEAVRQARQRGATALRRDVFRPLPGHGRWHSLLLADGNIGIGGDPGALLARCRVLLGPGGRLHAEVAAPGTPSWSGVATLHPADGDGGALPWATVSAEDLAAMAAGAGLRVLTTWQEADRWFATLSTR
jgi:SAM-dependent methyltransferase